VRRTDGGKVKNEAVGLIESDGGYGWVDGRCVG